MTATSAPVAAEPHRVAARQMVKLGIPLLIGAFSAAMAGIVDTAMMGRYGAAHLAAVSGGSAIFDIFSGIVLASAVGHQILSARFAGREDPAGIRRSLQASAWFCGGIAALLTVVCLAGGGFLMSLVSGGDAELEDLGSGYLGARAPTLIALVAYALLAAIFNAYQRPRLAMVAALVANAVNLVLDWALIYGPGPFPELGAIGNGLATTVSWLVAVGCLLVAARRFGLVALLRRPPLDEPVDFPTSVPRLGWPAIVSMALDYSSVAIFFAILGGIGEATLAGGRIAFEVLLLLFSVGGAFAAGGRILIGRSVGAGQIGQARTLWRTSQVVLLLPAVALGTALAVLAAPVARLFTSFPGVVDAAAGALPLVALCLPLMAWTLGNVSALRALGHTRWDMYGNLVAGIVVQLPLAWMLVHLADLGIVGAYLGVVGYWLARAGLTELLVAGPYARWPSGMETNLREPPVWTGRSQPASGLSTPNMTER